MTAQDAFAIAFDDEAWAMDAMPGMGLNMKTPKPAGSGLPKSPGAARGMGDQTSMGGTEMMTLAEHDEKNHKGGYKGGRCTWRDKHGMSGMTLEEAMSKGLANKKFPAGDDDETPSNGQAQQSKQPQTNQSSIQPQSSMPANPEMQEAEARQIAEQGPAAVVQKLSTETSADQLSQPQEIETDEGKVSVQTVGQQAAVILAETEKAKGNPTGEKAVAQLVQAQEDGTITQGESASKGSEVAPEQQAGQSTITSSDGSFVHNLSAEEMAVVQANPEKKEVLQQIVDASGKYAASTDEAEKEQIADGIKMLNQMFYGEKNPENASGEEPKEKETVKALEFEATDDKGNKVTGIIEADSRIDAIRKLMKKGLKPTNLSNEPFDVNRDDLAPSTPPPPPPSGGDSNPPPPTPPTPPEGGGGEPGGPNPPNNPPNPPDNPPDEDDDDSRSTLPPAPSDEEFRVGENKYKVGGVVYTDVSGKGLFRTALASFMAGLRGEGVITGWDRISGTWDAMKRSEKGEMVRDGIASALCRDTIANYANKDGLSDDAKMEIAVIQDMMNQADTPEAQMRAIKQFQKWKETYSKELGELDKPIPGQTFKPLPNDYKGTKPPVSILKKSEGFEADKEFGDKVAAGLQDRLGILGFQIEGLAGVSVGPSATTVKFKVPPTFDITAANSKKTRESLKGAIGGTEVPSVEYAKGETDVIAITVTNPEMRNVAFSDVINSQRWKTFAKKAALPIPLGRDSSGEETMLDAATMPQTIVTGATGSGKSVFISAAINGIEMEKTPDEARIVLLDPKNEFKIQDGSPHLLFPRAGGDPDKAKASKDMADVLDSLVAIMNDRVTKIGGVIEGFDPSKNEFKGAAEHSIKQYNEAHPDDKMPHILLVFDEIANARDNATAADKARIDLALQKLTAVGRSVGVNCLLATQRDDVGSIPGIIQANCPGRVTFKASPTDAKASQEAKALAGNGDYILTDKGGNKTRGRGCFISPEEEMAIPSYYRDHMAGGDTPNESTLPKEYTDGIAQAVKNKQPISVQAIEGMEDAFKKAIPDGWTIEHEKVDGDDHWKASPPKPTRVNVKDAKKPGEKAPKKVTKLSELDRKVNIKNLDSLKAYRDRVQSALDALADDEIDFGDYEKREKELQPFRDEIDKIESIMEKNFPGSTIQNGDLEIEYNNSEEAKETNPDKGDEGDDENSQEPEWESPLSRAQKPENRIAAARKRYEDAAKELEKRVNAKKDGITPQQYQEELQKLDSEYSDYVAQVKGNKSDAEIFAAKEEAEKKKEAEKKAELEKKKSLVRTTALKNPNRKIVGATNIMESYSGDKNNLVPMPNSILSKVKLPEGFEMDTNGQGKPVALNENGKLHGFARHPNGSWGKIDSHGVFIPMVNTDSPEILGEEHKETKKAKKKWLQAKANTPEEKEARKDYFLKAYGVEDRPVVDEFPDNKTIVANAAMEALKLVEG